jgi:hypothetical protein
MCFIKVDLPLPALPVIQKIPSSSRSHCKYRVEGRLLVVAASSKIQPYDE